MTDARAHDVRRVHIAVERAGGIARCIQSRNSEALLVKNLHLIVDLQAATRAGNTHDMLRNVVGRGVDRRHPKRALVEVEVFAFLAQLVITLNVGNEDILIEACDSRELFKGVRLMNRASLNVNFKLLGGIG